MEIKINIHFPFPPTLPIIQNAGSNSIILNNGIREYKNVREYSRPNTKYVSASVWDDGFPSDEKPETLESPSTLKHITWHRPSFDLDYPREKFLPQIRFPKNRGQNENNM